MTARFGGGAALLSLAAAVALAGLGASSAPSLAAGKIYYGSRAGMQVSVVSLSGLDTAKAVIKTKHTRKDATAFCRDYVLKVTEGCIRETLDIQLNDEIRGNCVTGVFTDFKGYRHQFRGRARMSGSMAKYSLVDLDSGQEADGSSASGYSVNMGILKALCPTMAPIDE